MLFRGHTPSKPRWGRTYGGQLVAQSLVAAARTVGTPFSSTSSSSSSTADNRKGSSPYVVHSLQCTFLRGGDDSLCIDYVVESLKDAGSFPVRLVRAFQKDILLYISIIAFHLPEGESIAHQESPPILPPPECFPLGEELCTFLANDPSSGLSDIDRRLLSRSGKAYAPFEIKFASPEDNSALTFRSSPAPPPAPPRRQCYVRTRGELYTLDETKEQPTKSPATKTDEQISSSASGPTSETTLCGTFALIASEIDSITAHAAALAYMSDWGMIDAATKPHRVGRFNPVLMPSSLTHNLVFHAHEFRADEWMLFDIYAPVVRNSRALLTAKFYTLSGVHVASATQEALIRIRDTSKLKLKAKQGDVSLAKSGIVSQKTASNVWSRTPPASSHPTHRSAL